jgi:hypothetical protein
MVLWRPEEHEELGPVAWDEGLARDAIVEIRRDAEAAVQGDIWPGHPLDETRDEPFVSLYLGTAGVVWALWELGSALDWTEIVDRALMRFRETPDLGEEAHAPSLWMGETGLLVVAERLGARTADPEQVRELILANRSHPTWELMWGSPGTMLAARACGLEAEWQDSAELLFDRWDTTSDTWTQDLYGEKRQFLGPAHGFAGNVHALRGYVDDELLRERVSRLLTRTAAHDGELVNWPPLDRPWQESESQARVQWCHGAPGIVATLGDLMPPELAAAGGELTWRAGPLRKGPGLCHGTAGNGFAFLKLHELTGDQQWLERAGAFAMHAIDQVRAARERYGQGRYTLWTGDLGVALYLKACIAADPAIPTIDTL